MSAKVVTLRPPGIRSETELKKFVKNHRGASPDRMVQAINISIQLAITADNASYHHRLNAGRLLLDLRRDIEKAGENFWTWQAGKFDRSRKDMEKLMRFASDDDPEGAIGKDRAQSRARSAKAYAMERSLRSKQPSDVERILELIEALTDQERAELRAACTERWSW